MYFAISTVIYNYDFCLFRTFFSFLKVFDCISCFYFENISKCFSSFSSLSFSFLYLPFLIHLSFLYRLSHSTTSFCFFLFLQLPFTNNFISDFSLQPILPFLRFLYFSSSTSFLLILNNNFILPHKLRLSILFSFVNFLSVEKNVFLSYPSLTHLKVLFKFLLSISSLCNRDT
jgi:hypothetical protein